MATCLIDVRCLQDPLYAERGVGRHAAALLRHAREMLPGTRLTGLADPDLPPLADAVRGLLDDLRPSAYTGALTAPCCHVQLSPMTHDPLFVGRLLHHPAIPAATAVYDFIPLDEPDRYLPSPEARLAYHVSLRWLARHQVFLPISAGAADRLCALLAIPAGRVAITGAPLDPAFEARGGTPRHVLAVGGGDPRKDPDTAVRAHAVCAAMQTAHIPLVVTGAYDAAWLRHQRAAATGLGGRPELIEAPGHVEAGALLRLYQNALCVVVPSRAEGFSLPVVEAMAAGVPVLASDIPAHRELMDARLFAPGDHRALASLLGTVTDGPWRAAVRAEQDGTWPRFRARAVAERFWSAVRRLVPDKAPAVPRGRASVALLTPLPPSRSGVADYSAAGCAELGKRVDLHLFTPTEHPVLPSGAASVAPLSALPLLSSRFDRVVHVLGNSAVHTGILDLLIRYGGAAIQHDGRMLDLYANHVPRARRERVASKELGRPVQPHEIGEWLAGSRSPPALMLGEVAAAAEPLFMHAAASVAEMMRRHGTAVTHLPFSQYRTLSDAELGPAARAAARHRLGFAPGDVLVAAFGWIHPTKAPIDSIWALDVLRSWGIPARLRFVGAPAMDMGPVFGLADELGLRDLVRVEQEYMSEAAYRDHLVAADLGLQLRTTGPGSVSGALADCIAAGLPTVASTCLVGSMDVPPYVRAVPDAPSPMLIAEALANLLGGPATAEARRAYAASHGFDGYAARLCAGLGLADAAR